MKGGRKLVADRIYLDNIAKQLNVKKQEDWYSIGTLTVKKKVSSSFFKRYNGSLREALQKIYPEFDWNPSRFQRVSSSFWKELNTQRKEMDNIAEQLGIETQEDWAQLTVLPKELRSIARSYGGSLSTALKTIYPEYDWTQVFTRSTAQLYWKDPLNARREFDKLSEALGIRVQQDWYSISSAKVFGKLSAYKMKNFNHSFLNALKSVYPEYDWDPFQFLNTPKRYKRDVRSHRQLFNSTFEQLNIETQEELYNITVFELPKPAKNVITKIYNGSLFYALKTVYPEYEWNSLRFHQRSPSEYWKVTRRALDEVAKELRIDTQEEWYEVTSEQLKNQTITHGLLTPRNFLKDLKSAYPEFDWYPWKMKELSYAFWSDSSLHRPFIEWLGEQLEVKTVQQWMEVPKKIILAVGGEYAKRFLSFYGSSWIHTLKSIFTDFDWPISMHFSNGQARSLHLLKSLFSGQIIETNYKLKGPNRLFELDIYIPNLSLAFEYQGGQHYSPILGQSASTTYRQQFRDREKRQLCINRGITLLEIPYWWYQTPSSLKATILKRRPDIHFSKT